MRMCTVMLQLPTKVRFKDYVNGGDVVIELKPNQTLRHHQYQPTDEGYDRTIIEWTYDGQQVTRTYFNEGSDCDGYMSSQFVQFCPVGGLRSKTVKRITASRWQAFVEDGETFHELVDTFEIDPGWPEWTEDSHDYYDANAVAAGY